MWPIDQINAWRSRREARKYFNGLRTLVTNRLESGRQTNEKWEKQFGWYDSVISRKEIRSKTVMDSLCLIRDINPDASLAIWNFLRLSNQGHELECLKHTGKPDKQGLEYLDSLAKRVGRIYGGGADQLINVLNLTGYTQGAIALEIELNKGLNEVVDFHAIDPSTLDFRRNEDTNELELVQKRWNGTYQVLNPEQVFYYPIDPDIGDPYGRSPILPILQIVFFQVEVLRDLKAVAHNQGHARFDISVTEQAIMENIPPSIQAKGADAVREFVMNYIAEIEGGFKNLKPDDNFFHTDSVAINMVGGTNGKSIDVTKIIDVINQQVVSALKQLPILLGRNEGSTETHGSIQWQIYVAGIESIQRATKRLLERAYDLALQIKGKQSSCKLTFDRLRTTDREKEARAEQLEVDSWIKKVSQGWADNNEAANAIVGHDAVADPQPTILTPAPIEEDSIEETPSKKKEDRLRRAIQLTRSDKFVADLSDSWSKELATLTSSTIEDIHNLLQRQLTTYIERIKEADEIPTRLMVGIESIRKLHQRQVDPTDEFVDWVMRFILYDSNIFIRDWEAMGQDWMEQAAILGGEASLLDLQAEIDFDSQHENLLQWLSNRAFTDAEYIQKTTDHDVVMTLWDVVSEGKYTISKAAEALQEAHGFKENRAKTIARTQMISASRAGQFHADKQSEMVIGKEWFAAHQPDRTREWHLEADGQIRSLDEPFEVNGEQLLFPGDTSLGASADNIINCRCGYFRILEGEEDKLGVFVYQGE
jgi:hypothetical protein